MQSIQVDHPRESRLRIVFSDTVVSFRLAAAATFEDVARTLDELPSHRYGHPVAIDITLSPELPDPAHRLSWRTPRHLTANPSGAIPDRRPPLSLP
jgi:hypothetical protein